MPIFTIQNGLHAAKPTLLRASLRPPARPPLWTWEIDIRHETALGPAKSRSGVLFVRLRKPPRALQEAFKRLSDASCAQDVLRDPVFDRF